MNIQSNKLRDIEFLSDVDLNIDIEDYFKFRSFLGKNARFSQGGESELSAKMRDFLDNSFREELSSRSEVYGALVNGFNANRLIQDFDEANSIYRMNKKRREEFALVKSVVNGALDAIKGKPEDYTSKHLKMLRTLYTENFNVSVRKVYETFHPDEVATLESRLLSHIIESSARKDPTTQESYITIGGAVSELKKDRGIGFLTPEIEHAKNQLYAFYDLFPFADAFLDLKPQYSRKSESVSDGFSTSVWQRLLVSGVGYITGMFWNRIPHNLVKDRRRKYRDIQTTIIGDKLMNQIYLNTTQANNALELHALVYGKEFTKAYGNLSKKVKEAGESLLTIDETYQNMVRANVAYRRYLLDREGHSVSVPRKTKGDDPNSTRNAMLKSEPFYIDSVTYKKIDNPEAAKLFLRGYRDGSETGESGENVLQWRNKGGEVINPRHSAIYVNPEDLVDKDYAINLADKYGITDPIAIQELYHLIVQTVRKNAGVKATISRKNKAAIGDIPPPFQQPKEVKSNQ